ncbi:hypothetical protein KNJ79_05235 [Sphingopyxis indica]|uniref:DUF6197 family protein n=1 Tax=Sphingopyxis indica TaxID=436663 RepID=UPI002938EC1B|nr:hypothetical protein [Sphingopyxis indica]WOF44336.1 hypothetical protein KNJ79_05235 [Sphingopyxis indica]
MLKDDLIAMRDLLADPRCWTQGAYGRDAKGHQLTVPHPEVTCWCLMGAAIQTIGHDITDEIDDHLNDSPLLKEHQTYVGFNDTHTHAEVLALLDERINALPA